MGETLQEQARNFPWFPSVWFKMLPFAPAAWLVSGVGVWGWAVRFSPTLHQSTQFLGVLASWAWAWWPLLCSPADVDGTHSRLLSCRSSPTAFAHLLPAVAVLHGEGLFLALWSRATVETLWPRSAANFSVLLQATTTPFPIRWDPWA